MPAIGTIPKKRDRSPRCPERISTILFRAIKNRTVTDELHITQKFLAYMPGACRAGLSKALRSPARHTLVGYSGRTITIHDRGGREPASCGRYRTDKAT